MSRTARQPCCLPERRPCVGAPAGALPRKFRTQPATAAEHAEEAAEAAAAAAAREADKRRPVPWGAFLRSSPVWAIIVAHFCFNWGYYTLLAWLPSYFDMALGERAGRGGELEGGASSWPAAGRPAAAAASRRRPRVPSSPAGAALEPGGLALPVPTPTRTPSARRCRRRLPRRAGLNVEKSSLLTLIPYVSMTLMTPLVGPIADGLASKHGWAVTDVRKLCQGISFAGPALCMLALALLTPATPGAGPIGLIVGVMSLAFALGAWSRAGLYCNHQDLSPKYAGALLGERSPAAWRGQGRRPTPPAALPRHWLRRCGEAWLPRPAAARPRALPRPRPPTCPARAARAGLSNTAGALPGVLGVTFAGYLLDQTGSWAHALFYPTAACQLLGLVVYTTFASSQRQAWD